MKELNYLRSYILENWKLDIMSKNRQRPLPYLKAATVVILHRVYNYTPLQIAPEMGIDRATVYYHKDDHDSKYLYHDGYADIYDQLYSYVMDKDDSPLNLNEVLNKIREVFND